MKRVIFFLLFFRAGYSWANDSTFAVVFQISGAAAPGVLHIRYLRDGVPVNDSVRVDGGHASYLGGISDRMTLVGVSTDGRQHLSLVVDPGDHIEVSIDQNLSTATITGSPASVDYRVLHAQIYKLFGKATACLYVLDTFIRAHPASEGAFLAMTDDGQTFSRQNRAGLLDSLQQVFLQLTPSVRELPRAKEYAQQLKRLLGLQVGAVAPDFSTMTIEDKPLKLSDLRGKYVLVDFWASWCIPCRHEFPYLKKAYARFKARNFEILGYSIDNDRSLWESAVSNDGVDWIQVSGLEGYKDPVAREYEIEAVPANWLLDPQGRIVARNLRGEEVEKVLAAYIK